MGKGESFVAVFVEADKASLHVSNVPVGEKVYLQRHPGNGRTISKHPGFVFEANHPPGNAADQLLQAMRQTRWIIAT